MKKVLLFLIINSLLHAVEFTTVTEDGFLFSYSKEISQIEDIKSQIKEIDSSIDNFLKLSVNGDIREVYILANIQEYHNYLESLDITLRDDYIVLQYSNRTSKLILYLGDKLITESLTYHMALQYMDHYATTDPTWFSKGIAYYISIKDRHRVIESLKQNNYSTIFSEMITTEVPEHNNAWITVEVLLNSGNREKRLFWDTLSKLHYDKTYTSSMLNRDFTQLNLDSTIEEYLNSYRSYSDYMSQGIELYSLGTFTEALKEFTNASMLEPDKYSPYYYIGMSYNGLKEYTMAYDQFTRSLDRGAPEDLLYYTIGLNFYQQKEFKQALNYLNKIEDSSYIELATKVIDEIETW